MHVEPIHVHGGHAVEVDGVLHAADGEVLDVRRLAAQNADHLQRLALILERLQVMREGDEVHVRRQMHRRMSPVAAGKHAELTAGGTAP